MIFDIGENLYSFCKDIEKLCLTSNSCLKTNLFLHPLVLHKFLSKWPFLIYHSSLDCTLRLWNVGENNYSDVCHSIPTIPSQKHIPAFWKLPYSMETSLFAPPTNPIDARCSRVFSGHTNEKNFVGLSVNSTGDFVACGSENNSVYTYHSRLTRPVIVHKFGNPIMAIDVRVCLLFFNFVYLYEYGF
jgi:hypothetical protein